MEQRKVTRNGIEIFCDSGEHLHSFCLSLYLRAGSLYEGEEENGISHFLEHIVIRNINWLMDGGLYPYLDRRGLMFNACTYKEFIQFEITGAKKHLREAIAVFTKLFEPIALPAAEIDIERRRIKAEIREDDERSSLEFFTGGIVWEGTSLAQTITGKSTRLDRMGKKHLQQAHRELFSTNNLFFYMTGCVEEEDIEFLSRSVESFELNEGKKARRNLAPVPERFFRRNGQIAVKQSKDTLVRFSFDLDTNRCSQAAYMLLYDILFDCENAKVHQALSEQSGCIYSFDPGMEQYSNIGNLYFQYEVQPSRLLESVEIVLELLCGLKQGLGDELDYVKPVYIDNGELILDHASNLNWAQAYEGHILGKTSTRLDERKKAYERVTAEELTGLCREVFRLDNLVVTMKGKKSKRTEQKIRSLLEKLDQEG